MDVTLTFSFDPEGDPLGVLLMIDFFALRSEQYHFLIRLFQEWEVSKFVLLSFSFYAPFSL